MDERTFKTLELDALIALLARHVQSPLGRKGALALKPSADPGDIHRGLNLTSEARDYIHTGGAFGLGEITDPAPALAELQVEGTSLDAQQILALQRLIAAAMDSREQFAGAEIKERHPNLAAV